MNFIYHQAKQSLIQTAIRIKKSHPNDKPMQRQVINDMADSLCKSEFQQAFLRELISEAKYNQWCNWLHNYACNLHP